MGSQQQGQQLAHLDLVTQLQSYISTVGSLFFGTIGELQRDAEPVTIDGEPLKTLPTKPYNAPERAKGFADELMTAIKAIETVVKAMPEPPASMEAEQEQLARIRELQQRSNELTGQLQAAKAVAEVKLVQAQELYGVLAHQKHLQMHQQDPGVSAQQQVLLSLPGAPH